MRYIGQNYELQVELDGNGDGEGSSLEVLHQAFFAVHERNYGYHNPDDPVEVVNLRVTAIGRLPSPDSAPAAPGTGAATPQGQRPVWFDGETALDTPVYDRAALGAGHEFTGPAVIEQLDATTLLGPGDRCRVDEAGNLVVEFNHD